MLLSGKITAKNPLGTRENFHLLPLVIAPKGGETLLGGF